MTDFLCIIHRLIKAGKKCITDDEFVVSLKKTKIIEEYVAVVFVAVDQH